MHVAICIGLPEYGSGCKFGCVGLDSEWLGLVGEEEYRGFNELGLEFIKCCLLLAGPGPWHVLLSQVVEGTCEIRVVGNESPVEVAKA